MYLCIHVAMFSMPTYSYFASVAEVQESIYPVLFSTAIRLYKEGTLVWTNR